MKKMKGYKAFCGNLSCRGFKYEIGKTYELDDEPIICDQGFHFCKNLADCYKYYRMTDDTRICEVTALGDIVSNNGVQFCTNKIRIDREVKEDWRRRGNANPNNTGYCNAGEYNTGVYNKGSSNAGEYNIGSHNTGNFNIGDFNTGDKNTGESNTGDGNTGDGNIGNYNQGHFNAGDWNTGSYNTGYFNTKMPPLRFFDKESDWTIDRWEYSRQCRLLSVISPVVWVNTVDMTEDERKAHPECSITSGYLKKNENAVKEWWDSLTEEERECFKELPNYDEAKFKKCLGLEWDEVYDGTDK